VSWMKGRRCKKRTECNARLPEASLTVRIVTHCKPLLKEQA
jgi:hypothetical protein